MNLNDISDPQMQQMLKNAGISNEKLSAVDKEKLNQILSNPEAVQKIMSSPAAQALLKRFKKD